MTRLAPASEPLAFLTLIDFSSLEIKVGFTEADAAKVKAGQPVTVTFDSLTKGSMACAVGVPTKLKRVKTFCSSISFFVFSSSSGFFCFKKKPCTEILYASITERCSMAVEKNK